MEAPVEIRPPAKRRPGAAVLVLAALAAAALGAAGAVSLHALLQASRTVVPAAATPALHGQARWAEGVQPAPAISTLRDQTGRAFSLSSLRGRTVALAFFDSHCTQACPLEGRALAAAERTLPSAERPVLVAVSVNPLDTAQSARRAARAWGLAAVAPWHWLMGGRRQLAAVWRAYHVYVASHPVNGEIPHTEGLLLIDPRGYERSGYLYPFATKLVTLDLRTLAPRGVAWR